MLADESRQAHISRIHGKNQAGLPESARLLYGNSRVATERRDRTFLRAAEVDAYLQSYHFVHCDYCERGWFGTNRPPPRGASLNDVHKRYMNFVLAEERLWLDPARPMCQECCQEVQGACRRMAEEGARGERQEAQGACPRRAPEGTRPETLEPQRFTSVNHMTFGPTHQAIDDLTFFEEQLLSPIQPVVRIFTLYGTGLTEARGHVANWVQNGPEYVRGIPLKAGDAKVLLVRRFPKDPNRKQRVPFVVSRTRLEAALNQLVRPEAEGGHRAFQRDRLVRHGLVPILRENLNEYDPDGAEPTGMQVSVVEQGGKFVLDKPLLGKWVVLQSVVLVLVLVLVLSTSQQQ